MEDDKQKIDYSKMAKAVVDEFMSRIYTETGKGLLKKVFWVAIISIIGYMAGHGYFVMKS